jgi:hypothetical protein
VFAVIEPMLVVIGLALLPILPPVAERDKALPEMDPELREIEPEPSAANKILPAVPSLEEDVILPLKVIPVDPPLTSWTAYPFSKYAGLLPVLVLFALNPERYILPAVTIGTMVRLSLPRLSVKLAGVPDEPMSLEYTPGYTVTEEVVTVSVVEPPPMELELPL